MFQNKTVFIVGAGASHEVGLPVGDDLKAEIAIKLYVQIDEGGQPKQMDTHILNALRDHVHRKENSRAAINKYLNAAIQIRGIIYTH